MTFLPAFGDLSARAGRLIFLVILIVAAAFRLPGLDRVPPPMYQDEASRGYDAWALLQTGADRHGERWPFFLESFGAGDYTAAITTYLIIPFIAVLGPTVTAIRLPDALLGVVTVCIFYVWLRAAWGTAPALIATAVLAANPWHVWLTRTGHETGYPPFFLALGLWTMFRAGLLPAFRRTDFHHAAAPWSFAAGIALSFHAWTYASPRLFTPLFLLAAGVLLRNRIKEMLRHGRGRWMLAAFAFGLILGGTPIWLTLLRHPEQLAARAGYALIHFNELGWMVSAGHVLRNFFTYLDPRWLFWQGEELTQMPVPMIGMNLLVVGPFILIGVVRVLARLRRDDWAMLLLAWFLLAHLPAVICDDSNPHRTRTICGLLCWPLLATLGAEWAYLWFVQRCLPARRSLVVAAAGLFVFNAAFFAHQYYRVFPAYGEFGHQNALLRAIQYSAKHSASADFILVTNRSNQPYIYALLFGPVPPRDLASDPLVLTRGPVNFHQVLRAGKYYFAPRDPLNYPDAQRLFADEWRKLPAGAEGLVIESPGYFDEGRVLATIHTAPNPLYSLSYEIRRWRPGTTE